MTTETEQVLQTLENTAPRNSASRAAIRLRWYQQEAVEAMKFKLSQADPSVPLTVTTGRGKSILLADPSVPLMVIPTGGGKSILLAEIARWWVETTGTNVICTIHTKELVHQNWQAFRKIAPDISAGVFSASLGRKDTKCEVTFANIQSICKKAHLFKNVGLWLIDEAHLMPHVESKSGQYKRFQKDLGYRFPGMRIAGCTATPWRQSSGNLLEPYKDNPPLFTDLAYELDILTLQEEGYLVEMIAEPVKTMVDNSNLKKNDFGEFTEASMSDAYNNDPINYKIVHETCEKAADRKSWLVFAVSVDHAERLAALFRGMGIRAAYVSGSMTKDMRDSRIRDFKRGTLQCLVNVGILTTGFDYPGCDAIVFARPCGSSGLFIQMLGRGLRVMYRDGYALNTIEERITAIRDSDKPDCLVLDYAGNVQRHGTVDKIRGVFKQRKKKEGDVPDGYKECASCNAHSPIGSKVCVFCGEPFPVGGSQPSQEDKLFDRQTADQVQTNLDDLITVPVNQVNGNAVVNARYHTKAGKPPSLNLQYQVTIGAQVVWVNEFLHFSMDQDTYLYKIAASAWEQRARTTPPRTTKEAGERISEMRVPSRLRLERSDCGRFWNVSRSYFDHH